MFFLLRRITFFVVGVFLLLESIGGITSGDVASYIVLGFALIFLYFAFRPKRLKQQIKTKAPQIMENVTPRNDNDTDLHTDA